MVRSCAAKTAPKFRKCASKKQKLHTSLYTHTQQNKPQFFYFSNAAFYMYMNNKYGLNGATPYKERCRACGRLLVPPKKKKPRCSYQCTEFSEDLHSVFSIDTHSDVFIQPLTFCYLCLCKQVMDRSILAQHKYCAIPHVQKLWTSVHNSA